MGIDLRANVDWANVKYVGSALSDAEIVLKMIGEDWGDLALVYMTDNFTDWTIGEYSWPENDTYITPYLGCNNDRMGHVPKGIIGIRMDGVENIVFNGLAITDIHEQGHRGSDLCGDYWDDDMTSRQFYGAGNTLQNTPYMYGYTGNRVHGIFSDFADYTFDGDIEIGGLVCDTGLVRGIGMYRQSQIFFTENSTLNMHDFSAGHRLYGEDTSEYDYPYNPAESKAFHIIWNDFLNQSLNEGYVVKQFNNSIHSEPKTVSFTCMFGRDGVNNTDWMVEADNTECTLFDDEVTDAVVLDAAVLFEAGDVLRTFKHHVSLWWIKVFVIPAVILSVAHFVWSHCGAKKSQLSAHSEVAPLLP